MVPSPQLFKQACRLIAGVLILLGPLQAPGAAEPCASTESCLNLIASAQRETKSLSARFRQTKQLSLLEETIVSTGHFAFKVPGQMTWEIEAPQRMRIVISDQQVHLPDLAVKEGEPSAGTPFGAFLGPFTQLFSGDFDGLRQTFDIAAAPAGDGIDVHLAPRRPELRRTMKEMELRFEQPDLTIKAIRVRNTLGDVVDVELEDVRRNMDIPDSMFDTKEFPP